MKTLLFGCAAVLGGLIHAYSAGATVRYVNANSTNAAPPYTNWVTAASNIQDAVDAASAGDEIVVTNGVYETGGRGINGVGSNRVAVTQPITVRSVNGSAVTVIRGYRGDPNNTFDQVRCAYLTNDAVLVGFTLTNGATPQLPPFPEFGRLNYGGGVLCESVSSLLSNCVLSGNSAYLYGGGVYRGTLKNCTLSGNSASIGGSAYEATLKDCELSGNSAFSGGGAYGGALNDCLLTNNYARYTGGGAGHAMLSNCTLTRNLAEVGGGTMNCVLTNCVLSGNFVERRTPPILPPCNGVCILGGGAYGGILDNCVLIGNVASGNGGGAYNATLNKCVLTGNSALYGGGAHGGTLTNCTLSGNSAAYYGGGANGSTLANCVLSDNSAQYGGGVVGGALNNCTLIRNSATNEGGGAWGKLVSLPPCIGPECPNPYSGPPILTLLNNCIVYGNSASNGDNYFTLDEGVLLNHSCTLPMPASGGGNITNAPLLVNAMASNFRLQSNSPCINAGRNAFASAGFDLDGNPRNVGGTVDMGAHEFQSPDSLISYAWRQHYFQNLPLFGLGDFDDADSDGQNNWQEWRAGTNPRDSASVLRLLTPVVSGDGVIVRWQGGAERSYRVERKRDLSQPAFDTIATNVPGQPGVTAYADTNAPNTESFFYRVRVED